MKAGELSDSLAEASAKSNVLDLVGRWANDPGMGKMSTEKLVYMRRESSNLDCLLADLSLTSLNITLVDIRTLGSQARSMSFNKGKKKTSGLIIDMPPSPPALSG